MSNRLALVGKCREPEPSGRLTQSQPHGTDNPNQIANGDLRFAICVSNKQIAIAKEKKKTNIVYGKLAANLWSLRALI